MSAEEDNLHGNMWAAHENLRVADGWRTGRPFSVLEVKRIAWQPLGFGLVLLP